MWKHKSRLGSAVEYYAVPAAAAVVGWILAARFVVPYAPAAFTDSALLGGALKGIIALVSFGLARRYL